MPDEVVAFIVGIIVGAIFVALLVHAFPPVPRAGMKAQKPPKIGPKGPAGNSGTSDT